MEMLEADLRSRLLETNEEFRNLSELHQKYDLEIEALEGHQPFTPDDEEAEQRLKKLKLQCKDRMLQILRSQAVAMAS
jgi:uncharacterized protein YdcH (DUF465 family)